MLWQSPSHQTYLFRQVAHSSNSASLEMRSFFTNWRAKSEKQKLECSCSTTRSLGRLCHHHSPKLLREAGGSNPPAMRASKYKAGFHLRPIRWWLLSSVKYKSGKV